MSQNQAFLQFLSHESAPFFRREGRKDIAIRAGTANCLASWLLLIHTKGYLIIKALRKAIADAKSAWVAGLQIDRDITSERRITFISVYPCIVCIWQNLIISAYKISAAEKLVVDGRTASMPTSEIAPSSTVESSQEQGFTLETRGKDV